MGHQPELVTFYGEGDDIIIVRMIGHVDADSLTALQNHIEAALVGRKIRGAILDTMELSSLNPNVTTVGSQFLGVLKKHGCSRSVCATASAMVRMLGSTIALAASMRMKFVDSSEAAKRELVDILAKEPR